MRVEGCGFGGGAVRGVGRGGGTFSMVSTKAAIPLYRLDAPPYPRLHIAPPPLASIHIPTSSAVADSLAPPPPPAPPAPPVPPADFRGLASRGLDSGVGGGRGDLEVGVLGVGGWLPYFQRWPSSASANSPVHKLTDSAPIVPGRLTDPGRIRTREANK